MKPEKIEEFKQASDARKRVLIAQDALYQLECGKYNARRGNWGMFTVPNFGSGTGSLQDLLPHVSNCTVCALGSLFVSQVAAENDFYVSEGRNSLLSFQVTEKLKKYFSEEQLDLIEVAFEGASLTYKYRSAKPNCPVVIGPRSLAGFNSPEDYLAALHFQAKHDDWTPRLMHILLNIVENEGTFNPMTSLTPQEQEWSRTKRFNGEEQGVYCKNPQDETGNQS